MSGRYDYLQTLLDKSGASLVLFQSFVRFFEFFRLRRPVHLADSLKVWMN